MWDQPVLPPTRAGINPLVPQAAVVTGVNSDGTLNVKLLSARATRRHVAVVEGVLDWHVGDRVVLAHLDGDPQTPVVLGRL